MIFSYYTLNIKLGVTAGGFAPPPKKKCFLSIKNKLMKMSTI